MKILILTAPFCGGENFALSIANELDYKVNLAVAYYRMYEYDEALSLYEEIKQKKPELVTTLDFIESMGEITPKYSKFD